MSGAARNETAAASRDSIVPLAALVVGAFAMGASPIFVRLADVGPFASAFWRVALALPWLWLWAVLEDRGSRVTATNRAGFSLGIVLAGLFFAGDLFFWHLSIVNTTVANATFFATMSPVIVLLAGWLLFRERIIPAHLAGLALCLLGGAMLIGTSLNLAPERLKGDIYGLVTACFFAAYIITVGRVRARGIGPGRLTLNATLITAAVLLPIALVLEPTLIPGSAEGWAALVMLGLFSHVGGQGLLSYALGHLPTNFSALVIFLEGVAAAILGWLVLNEALTPLQTAGATLIFAGVFIARMRNSGSQR